VFTVALIGPDGSGKTTIGRGLAEVLPIRAKYVYMGVNWDASNHLLPSTRLVQKMMDSWTTRSRRTQVATDAREAGDGGGRRRGPFRRFLRAGWIALGLMNEVTEEWYRQIVAWLYVRRGVVVIFDRHFFVDFYTDDVAGGATRKLDRRIHGFLLSRVYPRPDLVIYLDAPPEVLFARKGEGTLEWLERRRREYLELAPKMKHFVVVDASRPLHEVMDDVAGAILAFRAA
jgi:thymidylate kinase